MRSLLYRWVAASSLAPALAASSRMFGLFRNTLDQLSQSLLHNGRGRGAPRYRENLGSLDQRRLKVNQELPFLGLCCRHCLNFPANNHRG
jgi:hypothetical protein